MRVASPLVLILSLAVSAAAGAATKKRKDESPPTAMPDATLVAPDPSPPPATTAPPPSRPVEAAPIGARSPEPAVEAAAPQAAPPPQATPPLAPVVARAVQCLRLEAPRAARLEASVKLAADLLLENLCAAEVERAALFTRNTEALARFTPQSERAAAGLQGGRVDPETGELVNPPAGDVSGALTGAGDVTPPPAMRRFAAELVIEAKAPAASPTKPAEPHRKS